MQVLRDAMEQIDLIKLLMKETVGPTNRRTRL